MKKNKRCCGTCQYRSYENGEWTCDNEEADEYGLETDFNHNCYEYEERE